VAIASIQPVYTTRTRYRADLRATLESAIKLATIDVGDVVNDPGSESPAVELAEAIANIPVVPYAALEEALHQLFSSPLPPPSEREAEVRTPAVLNVWAKCPNCGIHLVIPLEVLPQLVLDDGGTGELKLKAKSKGRIHMCHQLTLDEPEGQLRTFAADQVGGEHEDVSEDAEGEQATPYIVGELLELIDLGGPGLDEASIAAWDQVTLELVADYARCVHLAASDNDVEIPDLPAVLAAGVPLSSLVVPDPEASTSIASKRSPAKPRGSAQASGRPASVTPDDRIGELRCQGSNHVPGHTPDCPKYVVS
jgi:hypothetical protein